MHLITKLRSLLQGRRARPLTNVEMCEKRIAKEHAPATLIAQANERARRHLARGMTPAQTLQWVIPWLRHESKRPNNQEHAK